MSDREIDHQLVLRAQQGDKLAFELLVNKYERKLQRLLSRLVRDPAEVEDVTQEAFIKAYRALPTFRGESAFYTWLYRIGINTAKNYLTAQGRKASATVDIDPEDAEASSENELARDSTTPEQEMMSRQVAETVNAAMDALPRRCLLRPLAATVRKRYRGQQKTCQLPQHRECARRRRNVPSILGRDPRP